MCESLAGVTRIELVRNVEVRKLNKMVGWWGAN